MDYRRRKKIQLKTPGIIPGDDSEKGKRNAEEKSKEALAHASRETRDPRRDRTGEDGQENGNSSEREVTEMRYGKRDSGMDGMDGRTGQRKSLNCSPIGR